MNLDIKLLKLNSFELTFHLLRKKLRNLYKLKKKKKSLLITFVLSIKNKESFSLYICFGLGNTSSWFVALTIATSRS